MITVLVGQRGTGKTHFLKRLQTYYGETIQCIDLDEYIEKKQKTKISDLFKKKGEVFFRDLEKKYFDEILDRVMQSSETYFLSVGGGFEMGQIPKWVRILWLRRTSEEWGRIFTDRPRLNLNLTALDEFFIRANPRSEKFIRVAWEEYLIPEGLKDPSKAERKLVKNEIQNLGLGLTLFSSVFNSKQKFNFFLKRRSEWGLKFFEVRDDLLNRSQFEILSNIDLKIPLLFALRSGKVSEKELKMVRLKVRYIDCDQLLFTQYEKLGIKIDIVSRHHRTASDGLKNIFQDLQGFEKFGYHVKLAVIIDSFEELKEAHQWFLENPKQRSFLPRSTDGRWQWYRQMMLGKMFIEFFREGLGSALDQPSLYQVVQRQLLGSPKSFAAIIGAPVNHSFTPIEQENFFEKFKCPVYAIVIDESEFDLALSLLSEWGMCAAAVTSPLKKLAFQWVKQKDQKAKEFQSINTIVYDLAAQAWAGTNTDIEGLAILFKEILNCDPKTIAVWGGGGTLPLIQKLLPKAQYFSAQTAQWRDGEKRIKDFKPSYVIWAAPRADGKTVMYPPRQWRPTQIIDLNYREDSGGRDYALVSCCEYKSGESMFHEQAKHQRIFWEKFLKK
jgi:shikimate kinase